MRSAGLTIGSLFSGIGGLELGLERAGLGPVKWQVEKDPYCRRVLASHWPDARRYDDVTMLPKWDIAPVDVVCGGFPCVEVSSAGRKGGLVGESGLWDYFAGVVRFLRPRYVVVENVGALASRGLAGVLRDLSWLRYDAEWSVVPACALGAPFPRERLFVVAYTNEHGEPTQPRHDEVAVLPEDSGHVWSGWANPGWVADPDDGVPRGVALRALGNAVVPQVAEVVGRVLLGIESRRVT